MNINDTAEQGAFRAEVRAWIETNIPSHLRGLRQGIWAHSGITDEELQPLADALARQGWLLPTFPQEYGGGGLDTMHMVIFNEEFTRAGVPALEGGSGSRHNVAQVLYRWGTEEQKERLLRPTLKGEIRWCQGYSEPGAGSDLAALALKAQRVEGGFLLNGQKIWTSRAHQADWIFILGRTDPDAKPKQAGISFFVADLRTAGFTSRPLITIDGFHHFNETFFDDFFVPDSGLVGELNKGWTVAKALLVHERLNIPVANPLILRRALDNVKGTARETPQGDGVLWDDPDFRRLVAEKEMAIDAMLATRYRSLTLIARGDVPGNETMILKLYGAGLFQSIVELHQRVVGPAGTTWDSDLFGRDVQEVGVHGANCRGRSIAGGTSEVQRNVIAKRVLELPN